MNKISLIKPTPERTCECFGPTCSFCKQNAPHPSPIHSDWSSEDWDGDIAKAKEQKSLIDLDLPKLRTDLDQTTDIDSVPFHNLSLGHDGQKTEESVEVTQSLVPLLTDMTNKEGIIKDKPGEDEEKQMEMELRLQKEEERYKLYDRVYIRQLSEEETTDMETDNLSYSYFG